MKAWSLAIAEIRHRWGSFLVAAAIMAAGTACLTGVAVMVALREARDRDLLNAKTEAAAAELSALGTGVRSAVEHLGFSVTVLPEGQDLGDWYSEDFARKCMPQNSLSRLAPVSRAFGAPPVAVLRQRLFWEERRWTVVVAGVGMSAYDSSSPVPPGFEFAPVRPGAAVPGHEIAASLDLHAGDSVAVQGRRFTVAACRGPRGTREDITLWLNLGDAQQLTGKPGMINEIHMGLSAEVAADPEGALAQIRRVLPGTEIVVRRDAVAAAAHAVGSVDTGSRLLADAEATAAGSLAVERRDLAVALGAVAVIVCVACSGLLAFRNADQRRIELGMLRAVGFGTPTVALLFVGRFALVTLIGGAAGFVIGAAFGRQLAASAENAAASALPFVVWWRILAVAAVTAFGTAVAAVSIPVWDMARSDPAKLLQDG